MTVELFANTPSTTVISGGTDAPASGTQETWTVASSAEFPAASSGASPPTQFHAGDPQFPTEIVAVTSVSGTTWTVTRGAESTTPVQHAAGFTIFQVVSAGALRAFAPLASPTFTGTPAAPTPSAGDATTRIATTAFVAAHVVSGQFLCTPSSYAPSAQVTQATTSATMAAITGAAGTVAAGSNGGEISAIATWVTPSAGVLSVANGTLFPAGGGTVNVAASGPTTAVVTYAGVSGNTLTGCVYVSGSPAGTVSTGGAVTLTSAAVSTGNFTAPASGIVLVAVPQITVVISADSDSFAFGLCAHGTVTPMVGNVSVITYDLSNHLINPFGLSFLVTGLTSGNSYNFDLMFAVASAGTLTVYAAAATSTSPTMGISESGTPVLMTVQAV